MTSEIDCTRYLEHIGNPQVDLATKIRLAEQVRLAVKADPALAEKIGLDQEAIDRLPKF